MAQRKKRLTLALQKLLQTLKVNVPEPKGHEIAQKGLRPVGKFVGLATQDKYRPYEVPEKCYWDVEKRHDENASLE